MDAEPMCKICVDACHALIPGIQFSVCSLNNGRGGTVKKKERERLKDTLLFER